MRWRRLGSGFLVLLWLGGCTSSGGFGYGDTLSVGQREEELVARKGQPQEVQPGPGGGKIYIYTTYNLDYVAAMGGGAWVKPDQVYYWLDDQRVITRVVRYPYGKRKFIFPTQKKPTEMVRAPAPSEVAQAPSASPKAVKALQPQPSSVATSPTPTQKEQAPTLTQNSAPMGVSLPAPTPQKTAKALAVPSSPPRHDIEAATRLELNMTREEVRRVLGFPERTEGFQTGEGSVIVWFYLLGDPKGRQMTTPIVFEEGRLRGWGENFYRRRLREILSRGR
jgi:hypothetical protein